MREVPREERPIVARAILQNAAGHINAGISFICELYVGKRFVVSQQHVETRLVLLDEVVFKRQCFLVVVYLDEIQVSGFGNQTACLSFRQTVVVKIAPYAAANILRFADVNDLSLPVFIKVNARLGRKLRYFLTKFHRQL